MTSTKPRALTLRFLIDGAPGSGVTSILRQLGDQRYIQPTQVSVGAQGNVDWLTFTNGAFDGQPIRLEVFAPAGPLHPQLRQRARQLADTIIMVVDSSPSGVRAGAEMWAALVADLETIPALDRPEAVVLAHKQDLPSAIDIEQVAAYLGLGEDITRTKTSTTYGGAVYALVLAARLCLDRVRRRDRAGYERNWPYTAQDLLDILQGLEPSGEQPDFIHPDEDDEATSVHRPRVGAPRPRPWTRARLRPPTAIELQNAEVRSTGSVANRATAAADAAPPGAAEEQARSGGGADNGSRAVRWRGLDAEVRRPSNPASARTTLQWRGTSTGEQLAAAPASVPPPVDPAAAPRPLPTGPSIRDEALPTTPDAPPVPSFGVPTPSPATPGQLPHVTARLEPPPWPAPVPSTQRVDVRPGTQMDQLDPVRPAPVLAQPQVDPPPAKPARRRALGRLIAALRG